MSSEATTGEALREGDVVDGRFTVKEVLEGHRKPYRYLVEDNVAPAKSFVMSQFSLSEEKLEKKSKIKRDLEKQLRRMSWVRHPGVLVPRTLFLKDNSVFSVVEQPSGVPIDEYVKAQGPPMGQIVEWLSEACDMLTQFHEGRRPLFLGSVPPAVLTITSDQQVQLSGFTVDRDLVIQYAPQDEDEKHKAPDEELDARSDVWCLGTLLKRCVVLSKGEVKSELNSQDQQELADMIKLATNKTQAKRMPNVAALKTRLERLAYKTQKRMKKAELDMEIKVHTVQEKPLFQQIWEAYRTQVMVGFLMLAFFIILVSFLANWG